MPLNFSVQMPFPRSGFTGTPPDPTLSAWLCPGGTCPRPPGACIPVGSRGYQVGWHEEVPNSTSEETWEMLCVMQTTKWGNVAVSREVTLDLIETCREVTSKRRLE